MTIGGVALPTVTRGRWVRALAAAFLLIVMLVIWLPSAANAMAGDLDPSFGTGGGAVLDLGAADRANAEVVQPDGKIVLAGTSGADFAIARLNPDGSLDSSFGAAGKVVTDFNGGV